MSTSFHPGTSPGLHDAAFEPHAGYMFEESGTMEQFRRDVDTSYDSNIISTGYRPRTASISWGDQMGNDPRQGLQPQGFALLDFPYHLSNGEPSPITPTWQPPETFTPQLPQLHLTTIDHRDGGVAQHFGQVTPVTPQSRSPISRSDDAQHQQQMAQSNAKSERARNAANHRHSQTKQAREFARKGRKGSASRRDDGEEDKSRGSDKQEYREKNRQAAAKCRRKKKDSTEILENKARSNSEENTRLKNLVRLLRDEFSDLRTKALAHDSCECSDIHQYNSDQAQQAARGHAGSPTMISQRMQEIQVFKACQAMSMQPSTEGNMITPEMPVMPLSRAQSFSTGTRPEMAMQNPERVRSDSMQDPVIKHAAALRRGGHGFSFDETFDTFQEDGRISGFQ